MIWLATQIRFRPQAEATRGQQISPEWPHGHAKASSNDFVNAVGVQSNVHQHASCHCVGEEHAVDRKPCKQNQGLEQELAPPPQQGRWVR